MFFIYALFSVFKSRIEIYPDRIRDVGLFGTTDIPINEISGFRVVPTQYVRTLLILPKEPKTKKINSALIVEHQVDLLAWLNQNFTNLDAVQTQDEMKQVLQDSRLGETEEQRRWVLERARIWAKILNNLGILVMFWAFLWPRPYPCVIWTLIILPVVALGFARYFDGALKFDTNKGSAFPNIASVFLLPCLALTLRAFTDFNILAWNKFWLPFAGVSLSLYLLTLLLATDVRKRIVAIIMPAIFCACYGYGTVISLNGILDRSRPTVYKARVINRHISTGKHTSYYLKLSAWGPRKEEKDVDVGKSVYGRHGIGDQVDVVVRDGWMEILWFRVR